MEYNRENYKGRRIRLFPNDTYEEVLNDCEVVEDE